MDFPWFLLCLREHYNTFVDEKKEVDFIDLFKCVPKVPPRFLSPSTKARWVSSYELLSSTDKGGLT